MKSLIDWFLRLIGIGVKPKPPVTPPPTPTPPVDDIEEIVQILLELHNQQRVSYGLTPFNNVEELDMAAQLHNDFMAETNRLTHDEPGRPLGYRISEQGYNWNYIGENIAMGQRTPEEVMRSWMSSSGHKSNILNPNFKDIGFGVTEEDNVWWWTVNFGRRM